MLQKWFSLPFVSLTVSYKMFSSVKRKKLSCSDQSNLVIKSKDAEIVKEVVWSLISLVLDFACGNVLRKQSEVCMFEKICLCGKFSNTLCGFWSGKWESAGGDMVHSAHTQDLCSQYIQAGCKALTFTFPHKGQEIWNTDQPFWQIKSTSMCSMVMARY